MLEGFASLVGVISNVMYSYLLIIMLLAVGLYFTLRSRFVQLRLLPESIRVVGEKTDSNSVSAFQALMVSTASRVGRFSSAPSWCTLPPRPSSSS